MASLGFPVGSKMEAKYKCPTCGKKWKSKNSSGAAKQCPACEGPYLDPYKTKPMVQMMQRERQRRMFGKYNCQCGNDWASGNTWIGKWQKCRKCTAEVMPEDVRPLHPGGGSNAKAPHVQSLCQKCIELGHNCRDYVPSPNEVVDIPDDLSVYSEASTTSSSSWSEDQRLSDGERTPVASGDEEQVDDFLEAKMKAMDINKKL